MVISCPIFRLKEEMKILNKKFFLYQITLDTPAKVLVQNYPIFFLYPVASYLTPGSQDRRPFLTGGFQGIKGRLEQQNSNTL